MIVPTFLSATLIVAVSGLNAGKKANESLGEDSGAWSFNYSAINVWPMPIEVDLPTTAAGPHGVHPSQIKTKLVSCPVEIQQLLNETLSLATVFKATTRTYGEDPYAHRDAYCSDSNRCIDDVDCGGNSKCFAPSDQRWNSTSACPPSAKYNSPCGCCVGAALPSIVTLTIDCSASSPQFANDNNNNNNIITATTVNESYTLDITITAITISAPTANGAAYALTTLAQLMRWDSEASVFVIDFVPLTIRDQPRFSWRGNMVDTSRHFIPLKDILSTLDGMYAGKLNTFHWHMVDSTSWPYVSTAYPELSKEGAWGASAVYTQDDIKTVMQRARQRFINVVIEIDTPAHTMAVGKSHPEMMTDCWEWMATSQYKVDVDSDDCQAINPTSSAARTMVKTVLTEVANLEGASPYVHVGGDEVKFPCWNSSQSLQDHIVANYGNLSSEAFELLQAEWTVNVSCAAVEASGKIPVMWQPTTKGPGDPAWNSLPANAVYMIWLNAASAKAYAQVGEKVVYTTPFYVAGMGSGGWLDVYNAQIIPAGLTPSEAVNVLGAEICMWGESMNAGNLVERGFQIGAGAAESFWRDHVRGQGPGAATGLPVSDRYNRFLCHLRRFGLVVPPIMPSFCDVVDVSATSSTK